LAQTVPFAATAFGMKKVGNYNWTYVVIIVALFELLDRHLLARHLISSLEDNAVGPKGLNEIET